MTRTSIERRVAALERTETTDDNARVIIYQPGTLDQARDQATRDYPDALALYLVPDNGRNARAAYEA